jgi:hypothetical protein
VVTAPLVRWAAHEHLMEQPQQPSLGGSAPDCAEAICALLESTFSRKLVAHALRLLCVSPRGLASSELSDLLEAIDDRADVLIDDLQSIFGTFAVAGRPSLPIVKICPRELLPAIQRRYFHSAAEVQSVHRVLAGLCLPQCCIGMDGLFSCEAAAAGLVAAGAAERALVSLPYHLESAEMWDALCGTLTNLTFVHACAHGGLLEQLLAHYGSAIPKLQRNVKLSSFYAVAQFYQFLLLHERRLRVDPDAILVFALESPQFPIVSEAVAHTIATVASRTARVQQLSAGEMTVPECACNTFGCSWLLWPGPSGVLFLAERRPGFISGLCQLLVDGMEMTVSAAMLRLAASHPPSELVCRNAKLTMQSLQKIKAAELHLYEEYSELRRLSAQIQPSGTASLQRDQNGWNALHRAAFGGYRYVCLVEPVRLDALALAACLQTVASGIVR